MRRLHILLTISLAIITLTSCFKEEKQGTKMCIALYSQNVAEDPILKTTSDIEGYAFIVPKGSKWKVLTWDDALNRCITNSDNESEQLTAPEILGTYNPEAEFQLTFELWTQYTFMVIVDKTNRIYATRFYETPMNLPSVNTHLHLYAWRKTGSANGWDVTNPFPDEAREPLVPQDPAPDEGTDEGTTPDDGTAPDDGTDEKPGEGTPDDGTTDTPNEKPGDGTVEAPTPGTPGEGADSDEGESEDPEGDTDEGAESETPSEGAEIDTPNDNTEGDTSTTPSDDTEVEA